MDQATTHLERSRWIISFRSFYPWAGLKGILQDLGFNHWGNIAFFKKGAKEVNWERISFNGVATTVGESRGPG